MRRWDSHYSDNINTENQEEAYKVTDEDRAKWDAKQDALVFDKEPTLNSSNMVNSSGIYNAIKAAKIAETEEYKAYFQGEKAGLSTVAAQLEATAQSLDSTMEEVNTAKSDIYALKETMNERTEAALSYRNGAADSAETAKEYAQDAFDSANRITSAIDTANEAVKTANAAAVAAQEAAAQLEDVASRAETAANNAATSETNAATSATSAATAESNAATSATNASTSETSAANSATLASSYADNASASATSASNNATRAGTYATTATSEAAAAEASATLAKSYTQGGTATRDSEDTDNAKYYYEQSVRIAIKYGGAIKPKGTVTFAQIPTEDIETGDMYNISEEFTTDVRFVDGTGRVCPLGTNIYYTSDGKWDVLAGTPVTGVKGSAEDSYRRGNVNITEENILHGEKTLKAALDDLESFVPDATSITYGDSNVGAALDSILSGGIGDVTFTKDATGVISINW